MKFNKIISALLSLTLLFTANMAAGLAKEENSTINAAQIESTEKSVSLSSIMPAYTNVPDFSHTEYWGGTANSGEEEYGQCNWYVAGVLNQMYGKLPGVDLNASDTRYNFKWLGDGAHYASNLVGRWGPGNKYGNPVYFELSDQPADGAVYSISYGNGLGHTGIILKTYPDEDPLILSGNFDGPSNTWDYAIKYDWKILRDNQPIKYHATYAVPVGLAKQVQDVWKASGLRVKSDKPYNNSTLYNSQYHLDNSLQVFSADGDKVYPRDGFGYFKTPVDCSFNGLLKRVLYYGIGGVQDKLSEVIEPVNQALYMNELVQAASFGGDRSHTCFSYARNTYGWDNQAQQDEIFNKYWKIVTDPALAEPPAEYKVFCLESDDLSLRDSMFFGAGTPVDWGPTARMVFGVDTRGLSFKVDSSWLDGDPELGGKETAWPDGYASTISALVNGQPAGKSIQLSRETPSGILYNLPYIDLNTFKLNTITIKQETAPGKWSWPGSQSSLDEKGKSYVYSLDLERNENGQIMIPLAIHSYQSGLAFNDLTGSAYYLSPVLWAAKKGITTGKSATAFDPGGNCTRAETVTFLYRLAGSPEVSETKNPFKDVKESDYFYKPVLWAMEKGITTGKQADMFAPDDPCTRAEFVTFLWRYDGGDPNQIMGSYVLDDVNPFNYFYRPVGWAFKNEITTGTSAMTFSPNRGVNRGEAVTFLYRYYKKFIYPSESADEQEDKTEDVGPSETEKESEKENKNDENKDEALI